MINAAGHLLSRVLLPPGFFQEYPDTALSSLSILVPGNDPFTGIELSTSCTIIYQYSKENQAIESYLQDLPKLFQEYLFELYLVLFKSVLSPRLRDSMNAHRNTWYRLSIVIDKDDDQVLNIFIPDIFFKRYMGFKPTEADEVEEGIIHFFSSPFTFFPPLRLMLENLSNGNMEQLLHRLFTHTRLTEYQVILLLRAFPEHSLIFKGFLSKQAWKDLVSLMERYQGDILGKRDELEGIYSVQESIHHYYRSEKAPDQMKYFHQTIQEFFHVRPLLHKQFTQWLDVINNSGLLHQVLAQTDDYSLASLLQSSVHGDFLHRKLPDHRLKHCLNINIKLVPALHIAQGNLLQIFRKERIKRTSITDTGFSILFTSIQDDNGYEHLLAEAGWYRLSTALKGLKKK